MYASSFHFRLKSFIFTAKLTETQLLALVPPSIAYMRAEGKSKATTYHPLWARSPHSVQKWDNFIQNADEMDVDDDTTPQFKKPRFFKNFEASEERDVQDALRFNVLDALSMTIGRGQPSKEEFFSMRLLEQESFSSGVLKIINGSPDFVLLAGRYNLFLLPVEVRTKWILPDDNIVEILDAEHPPVCVSNSITQIFGYMAHNKRRYGVLSTYDKTWFLQRPENDTGALFISDAVACEDASPTLLRCFAYIMSLARQNDSDCPFPSPSSPPQTLGDNYRSSEEKDDGDEEDEQLPRGFSGRRDPHKNRAKREAPSNKQLNRGELTLEKFDWCSFEVRQSRWRI